MTTVVRVPQWQGAATERARLLPDGSGLLARAVPGGRIVPVRVPDDAGTARDGVRALDVLIEVADGVRAALAEIGSPTVVTGGDCGVELEPVAAASARHGDALAVVWFDAHGDLNTPEGSPSGAFHGMVLRTLLGEGPAELVPSRPLRPGQVVLAGARALDPDERAFISANGIARVAVPDIDGLVETVAATGASAVYVHVDLDVLDPGSFRSLNCPEPGGLTPEALAGAVRALTGRFVLAGLGVTEYTPVAPRDRETVDALVAAFTDPLVASG